MRVTLIAVLAIVSCKQQLPAPAQSGVADVTVTEKGFEPERIQVKAGQQVTLLFTRKVAQTCADAVDAQSDQVRHMLPVNAHGDVKVTSQNSGELAVACRMNMDRE